VVKLDIWASVVETRISKSRTFMDSGSPCVAAGFNRTRSIGYVPLFASSTIAHWLVVLPNWVDQPNCAVPSMSRETSHVPP
jgi:hypothetical protein